MIIPGKRIIQTKMANSVRRNTKGNKMKPNTQRKHAKHFDPQLFFFLHFSLEPSWSGPDSKSFEPPTSWADSLSLSLPPLPISESAALCFVFTIFETQLTLKTKRRLAPDRCFVFERTCRLPLVNLLFSGSA